MTDRPRNDEPPDDGWDIYAQSLYEQIMAARKEHDAERAELDGLRQRIEALARRWESDPSRRTISPHYVKSLRAALPPS